MESFFTVFFLAAFVIVAFSPHSTLSTYSSNFLICLVIGLARVVGLLTLEPENGTLEGQVAEAELGSALAMHVVAAKPLFLSKELVPESYLNRETDIFRSQVSPCFL